MNDKKNIRKKIKDLSSFGYSEIGKLPPQAIDLEEAVLGAVILEDECYHQVADMLIPEIFYKEQNAEICRGIISLKNRGEKVDLLTLTQELKTMGMLESVGGAYYVSMLTNRISSSVNIEAHIRIVQEKFIKRDAIRASTALIREAYDDTSDAFDIIDEYEKSLTQITSRLFISKMSDSGTLFKKLIERNEILRSGSGGLLGVPSGFHELDVITGGFQRSDLIVIAARPGMGKSALAVQIAKNAAIYFQKPTAVFSLEMSELQLFCRMCSQETQIPLEQFTRSGLDKDTLARLYLDRDKLVKAQIFVDDTAGLTLFDFRNKARKLKREKKIELIVLDYIQLMEGNDKGNREQEVSQISRGLKVMAKELDIPIIALSQLSRQVENRPGSSNIPKLSDLRESGAIEQDADMVLFIYRPEYYGLTQDADGEPTKGKAKIIIAKNRQGAVDTVDLRWEAECTMFKDFNAPDLAPMAENTNFLNNNSPY